jgi:glycolate oxidase FAD binding subunit
VSGDLLVPETEEALREVIAEAAAAARALEIEGRGTKRGLGRPVSAASRLSLAALSGIAYYEPGELVMEAHAGTPLAEIEAALAENGQHLAFEPGGLGRLYGDEGDRGTIGGVFACNLSGPRRPFAGAARDHLLGIRAVSGRGEAFASGGRVVKNVTGYDMGKLLAGSHGTLAVLARVTFKVLPRPAATRTVLLFGIGPADGLEAIRAAGEGPWEIGAAAHLGPVAAARSRIAAVAAASGPVTAIRLEGTPEAIGERAGALKSALSRWGGMGELETEESRAFWAELRDGALLPPGGDHILWRLSLPPAAAAGIAGPLASELGGELLFDWAGGLAWLALPGPGDGDGADMAARRIRGAVAPTGGHATLFRAPGEVRARIPVFEPEAPALAALTRRLKENFDPNRVLNPGRMYEGV